MNQANQWIEIYNNKFCKIFSAFKSFEKKTGFGNLRKLPKENKAKLCRSYDKLFEVSCNLLFQYLCYNGICQSSKLLVIKSAYNSEVISNGQKWINLLFVFQKYKQYGLEKTERKILCYLNIEYLKIFEQLDSYMKMEIESLEKKNA